MIQKSQEMKWFSKLFTITVKNLIKNIKQFPHGGLFQKMGIDIKNQNETIKNYISDARTVILEMHQK